MGYLELLEDSDMIFILFCLKFGLAVGCNGVCDVVELDMTKIRDDSSQHFCWNRPNFRKWFQRNYFHKKGVRLVRMEDSNYNHLVKYSMEKFLNRLRPFRFLSK